MEFNLNNASLLVRFTFDGEMLYNKLRPNVSKDENGYYEIYVGELFCLYKILLMGDANAQITDLVDADVIVNNQPADIKTMSYIK